jgi:OOP family OmpA-OmpF porin
MLFGSALPACTVQMGSKTPDSPPPAPAPAAPAAAAPAATTPPAATAAATPTPSEPAKPPEPTAGGSAPAPASSGVEQKGGSIQLPGKIQFNTGSSTLTSDPNNTAILQQLKNFLVENDKKLAVLRIEGYTDNQGDPNKNLDLSGQRALTIKNWLISNGIDQSRLLAVGFGQDKPIAPNTTDDGRAQNRRVEYKVAEIYDKKGKAQIYLGGKDALGGGKEYK